MSQTPDRDEQEFLKERQQALRESIKFFAPEQKVERETWVCSAFLQNLGIQHAEAELIPEPSDPPDIHFRGARFEIKEILDPDRKRHAEYREKLEKALLARSASELLEHYTPEDLTYREIGDIVIQRLTEISAHYDPKVTAQLDLLIYVNLLHCLVNGQSPVPSPTTYSGFGWRSIGVVKGWSAWVLHARPDAPSFLQTHVGKPAFRASME